MRTSTLIVVITATMISIGVALGIAMSGGGPNRIDGFEQIVYVRNVEHGQLSFLGSCPLDREIIVEQTGKTRISWYAQQPGEHGCGRATDFRMDSSDEKWWDEPKVARIELTLSPADVDQLVERVEALSWKIEWATLNSWDIVYSTGCERKTTSLPDRQLLVEKSQAQVAVLAMDDSQVQDSRSCSVNENANEAALDAAFASFVPLLPSKYDLRPEVASRLYREK